MVQERLTEQVAENENKGSFAVALIYVMNDIMPDVMTNQFGNYLC